MTARCADIRHALGVYVVGAIDPAERAFVDQHLAACQECRDELAGLAGLPALLGRVTLQEVERASGTESPPAAPPERLLNSMLARLAGQQRARRLRNTLLSAAASVAILAGAAVGVRVIASGPATTPPPQHVAWTKVTARSAATNVVAKVKFLKRSWGTETDVAVAGVKYGTRCTLWVTDSSGRRMAAGSWQYEEKGQWYPGSTSVPVSDISSFEVTAHGKTLVTVPVT